VASFVDTNVLVYAEDRDDERKHSIARDLVVELWRSREGVLSVQVLQEFFVTVTRKIARPLSATKAQEIVQEYLRWRVVDNTGTLLTSAIGLVQRSNVSFWDAMIIQAAIDAGCHRIYSEDLNDGQRFESATVHNPFAKGKPTGRGR